jgi:hypothetical protein
VEGQDEDRGATVGALDTALSRRGRTFVAGLIWIIA